MSKVLWDQHLHTTLSFDGVGEMENMCRRAMELGLARITFTEHIDYHHPQTGEDFSVDFDAYRARVEACREQFPRLSIGYGIEAGITAENAEDTRKAVASQPFDCVLASQHVVANADPYFPVFFEGRDRAEAVRLYAEELYHTAKRLPDFDVMTHIGYVTKFGPYTDQPFGYEDAPDILDEVLKELILSGRSLEVNTSGYLRCGEPYAAVSILKRYRQLGGEMITFGSDAHDEAHMAQFFDAGQELVKSLGFRYCAVYRNRRAEMLPL